MLPASGKQRVLAALDEQIARYSGEIGDICRMQRAAVECGGNAVTAEAVALAQWFATVRGELVDCILDDLNNARLLSWTFVATFPYSIGIGNFVQYPADIPLPRCREYLRAMLQKHIVAAHPYVCVDVCAATPTLGESVTYAIYATD